MEKQTVTRTRKKGSVYSHEYESYSRLDLLLKAGWVVVLCTPIGDELEYILKKEVVDNENK